MIIDFHSRNKQGWSKPDDQQRPQSRYARNRPLGAPHSSNALGFDRTGLIAQPETRGPAP